MFLGWLERAPGSEHPSRGPGSPSWGHHTPALRPAESGPASALTQPGQAQGALPASSASGPFLTFGWSVLPAFLGQSVPPAGKGARLGGSSHLLAVGHGPPGPRNLAPPLQGCQNAAGRLTQPWCPAPPACGGHLLPGPPGDPWPSPPAALLVVSAEDSPGRAGCGQTST